MVGRDGFGGVWLDGLRVVDGYSPLGKKVFKAYFDETHAFEIRCLTYFDSNFFRMIPMTIFLLLCFFVLGFASGLILTKDHLQCSFERMWQPRPMGNSDAFSLGGLILLMVQKSGDHQLRLVVYATIY